MRIVNFAALFSVLLCLSVSAQPFSSAASPWADDMDAFVLALGADHPNPYHTTPKAEFNAAVEAYKAAAFERSYAENVVAFARVVALVGDAHTVMPLLSIPFPGAPPGPDFRLLPIRMKMFADGVFVVGAHTDHAALVGGRVTHIGGVPMEDVWREALTLSPKSSPRFAMELTPNWLSAIDVLNALGFAASKRSVAIRVEKEGASLSANLAPLNAPAQLDWVRSFDDGPMGTQPWVRGREAGEPPLWLRNLRDNVWFSDLPDAQGIYLHFNEIRDLPNQSFDELMGQMFAQLDSQISPHLIIDLRMCMGGNGMLNAALVERIAARASLNQKGRVFVLTSQRTLSAAVMLVSALEQKTNAIFVGAPTGDRPNHYGETNIFMLPNAKMPVIHSSEFYQTSGADDERPWRTPDIAAPFHYADYATGRDPGLKAILNHIKDDK